MALFPDLPENPHLADVFKKFPEHVRPLLEYHDVLLRGDSPLTIAERELIAAYVSGLNACKFCFEAHKIYTRVFGIPDEIIDSLMHDPETAKVDEKLKPLLAYAKKLTTLPANLTTTDAQAVYSAGWSDRALYDTIEITALFNLMNRLIEGTGVNYNYTTNPPDEAGLEARRTRGYVDFGREIGVIE